MARISTLLGLGAWLTFGLLGGCNSVLGIEEAVQRDIVRPSPASGGSGPSSTGKSISIMNAGCDQPSKTCQACMAGACVNGELEACLAVEACRNALDSYRRCLGSAQCDPGDDHCLEDLSFVDIPETESLSACIKPCGESCKSSSLASMCEMYCGCMQLNCASKVQGDCLTSCAQESFADIACRLDHCSWSPGSLQIAAHCGHAVGSDECPRVTPIKADCDDGRKASGWRCTRNEECCSKDCTSDEICN